MNIKFLFGEAIEREKVAAVADEREACALAVEAYAAELRADGDSRHAASVLDAARIIRERGNQ